MPVSRQVQSRLPDELYERLLDYRQAKGITSDSAVVKAILQDFLDTVDAIPGNDCLAAIRRSCAFSARHNAANTILLAMEQEKARLDICDLAFNQRLDLSLAAAGPYLKQKQGRKDINAALCIARRLLRRGPEGKRIESLLGFLASMNSQLVFNALDPLDLESWISGMFAYRRGVHELYDFDYEVGCRRLSSILDCMGVNTVAQAREKFDGTWFFRHEEGWVKLSSVAIKGFVPVIPSEYTLAFDPLDPNPENYAFCEEDCVRLREEHERYVNEREKQKD